MKPRVWMCIAMHWNWWSTACAVVENDTNIECAKHRKSKQKPNPTETDKRTNSTHTSTHTQTGSERENSWQSKCYVTHITIIESISRINNVNVRSEFLDISQLANHTFASNAASQHTINEIASKKSRRETEAVSFDSICIAIRAHKNIYYSKNVYDLHKMLYCIVELLLRPIYIYIDEMYCYTSHLSLARSGCVSNMRYSKCVHQILVDIS